MNLQINGKHTLILAHVRQRVDIRASYVNVIKSGMRLICINFLRGRCQSSRCQLLHPHGNGEGDENLSYALNHASSIPCPRLVKDGMCVDRTMCPYFHFQLGNYYSAPPRKQDHVQTAPKISQQTIPTVAPKIPSPGNDVPPAVHVPAPLPPQAAPAPNEPSVTRLPVTAAGDIYAAITGRSAGARCINVTGAAAAALWGDVAASPSPAQPPAAELSCSAVPVVRRSVLLDPPQVYRSDLPLPQRAYRL